MNNEYGLSKPYNYIGLSCAHNERALFKCAQCTKILRVYYRGDTQRIFAPKTKFDPFKKKF